MMNIDPVFHTTITDQIIKRIINLIVEGNLNPGDRLPSEHELLEKLGCGRSSLREALRTLSLIGLLEPRRGSGTFVTKSFSNFLADQIEWSTLLGDTDLLELIEVRQALEVKAAFLAAERANEQDISRIQRVMEQMESLPETEYDNWVEIDLKFHMELAKASDNKVLYRIMSSLDHLIRRFISETKRSTMPIESTIRDHQAILAGIQSRDPQMASEAMKIHLESSQKELLDTLSSRSNKERVVKSVN
jgi:GntR family transcriptional repressor for pyruvate dehydrogenase complex